MIHKLYLRNKPVFIITLAFISTMIFMSAPIVSMPIVSNVNAADKKDPGHTCSHVPGSGTIGQVRCCLNDYTKDLCTICDNTTPPSNCQPPTPGKDDSGSVFDPNKGGVLSQNDDSSGSKGIDPGENQEGGTFNNDDGSNSPSNSENKIDSSNILEGGSFNQ